MKTSKSHTKKNTFAEIAGWYAMAAILSAYGLVSFSLIESDGWLFQILNLTGALGFIIIATVKKLKQTVILNIFWAAVAVFSLVRLLMTTVLS